MLWAFWANMGGPWFKRPQKVKYSYSLGTWWHRNGNAEVQKLGLEAKHGNWFVVFASESKQEVQRFMDGFNACRMLIRNFSDER